MFNIERLKPELQYLYLQFVLPLIAHLIFYYNFSFSAKLHAASLQQMILAPPAEMTGHPYTSLQVGMVQHRSKVNTIRVELLPWCLLVNETEADVTICEEGGESVIVRGGTTVVPQRFNVSSLYFLK